VVADGQASLAAADDDGLDLLDHGTETRLPAWAGASVNSLILILRAWSDLTMPEGLVSCDLEEAVFQSESRGGSP
jgi:hypothetical protein